MEEKSLENRLHLLANWYNQSNEYTAKLLLEAEGEIASESAWANLYARMVEERTSDLRKAYHIMKEAGLDASAKEFEKYK